MSSIQDDIVFMCDTHHVHVCVMTNNETRCRLSKTPPHELRSPKFTWDMTHVRHDSFIRVTCLVHVCDTTHSQVWHDSFTCVMWLIYTRDMTQSYAWHDSFTSVTWLVYVCDETHSCMWHTGVAKTAKVVLQLVLRLQLLQGKPNLYPNLANSVLSFLE